jgi:hypothetical protein
MLKHAIIKIAGYNNMRLSLRIAIFITIFSMSIGLALTSCDENKNNSNDMLMILLMMNTDPIFIFNGGLHNGDLKTAGSGSDGRIGADNVCKAAQVANYSLLGGRTIKAFLSVSSMDLIKDVVPAGQQVRPVYGMKTDNTVTLLKDSWTDLWGGTGINATLGTATGIPNNWWSASNFDGTYYINGSCTNWTLNAGPVGVGGDYNQVDNKWAENFGSNCEGTYYVLCVAY